MNARRNPGALALVCGLVVTVAGSLLPLSSAKADAPGAVPSWETYGNVLADPYLTSLTNAQFADAGPTGTVMSMVSAPASTENPWNEAKLRVGLLPEDAGTDVVWTAPTDQAVWLSSVAGDRRTGDAAVVFLDTGTELGACNVWELATYDADSSTWADPRPLVPPLHDPEVPASCPSLRGHPQLVVSGGAAHVLLAATDDDSWLPTLAVTRVPVGVGDSESTVLDTDVNELPLDDAWPRPPVGSLGVAPDGSVHAGWAAHGIDDDENGVYEVHAAHTDADGLGWSTPSTLVSHPVFQGERVTLVGDDERLLLVAQHDVTLDAGDPGNGVPPTVGLRTVTSALSSSGAGAPTESVDLPLLVPTLQSVRSHVALRAADDATRLFVLDGSTPSGLRETVVEHATEEYPPTTGLDADGRLWAASPCEAGSRYCASRWDPSTTAWVDEATLPSTMPVYANTAAQSAFAFVRDTGSPTRVAVVGEYYATGFEESAASLQLARRPSVGPESPAPDWAVAEELDVDVSEGDRVSASPAGPSGAVIAAQELRDEAVVLRAGIVPADRTRPTSWGPSNDDMGTHGGHVTAADPGTGDAAVVFHELPTSDRLATGSDLGVEVWTWSGDDRAWSGPIAIDRDVTLAGRPGPSVTVVDGTVHVLRREETTDDTVEVVRYAIPVGGSQAQSEALDSWDASVDSWDPAEGWAYQYEPAMVEAAADGSVHALWSHPSATGEAGDRSFDVRHSGTGTDASSWSEPSTLGATVDGADWVAATMLRDGGTLVAVAQTPADEKQRSMTTTTAVLTADGATEPAVTDEVPLLRGSDTGLPGGPAAAVTSSSGTTGVLAVDPTTSTNVRVLPEPFLLSRYGDAVTLGVSAGGGLWAAQHARLARWDEHLRRWIEQPSLPPAVRWQHDYGKPLYALLPDPTAPTGIAVLAAVEAEGGWPLRPAVVRDGPTVITPYPTPTETATPSDTSTPTDTASPTSEPTVSTTTSAGPTPTTSTAPPVLPTAVPVVTPPPAKRPRPVADLRARTKRNGDVVVRWDRGAKAGPRAVTGYTVRVGKKLRTLERRTPAKWVHRKAKDGKRYRYVVRATNDAGGSKPRKVRHTA